MRILRISLRNIASLEGTHTVDFTRDPLRAKQLGFGAKLCIHPKQVAAVNAAFIPSEKDVAWAHRVVEGATASHGAAVAVDGRMVDRPVILKAQEILAESQRRLPLGA